MSKIQLFLLHEGDGYLKLYGPKDKVTVRVIKTLDPQRFTDAGSVDDQVLREAPWVWENLMLENRVLATSKPRPYQRVIPIEEMDWWEIVKHLCFRMVDQSNSLGITTPLQSQCLLERLNDIQQEHSSLAREYLLAWLFYPAQICPHCKKGVFHE